MKLFKSASGKPPDIDTVGMSASTAISTMTPDRQGDVVDPLGVRLENYARNPIVMFDHGMSGITMPIGKSEDADGNLTITVSDDELTATCYFAQEQREASQVFDLIVQKVIRAASISPLPIKAVPISTGGHRYDDWELLEWSWCGIPVNAEAVRKALDRGKLAGSPICEPIRKALAPYAVRTKREAKSKLDVPDRLQAYKTLLKSALEILRNGADRTRSPGVLADLRCAAKRMAAIHSNAGGIPKSEKWRMGVLEKRLEYAERGVFLNNCETVRLGQIMEKLPMAELWLDMALANAGLSDVASNTRENQ